VTRRETKIRAAALWAGGWGQVGILCFLAGGIVTTVSGVVVYVLVGMGICAVLGNVSLMKLVFDITGETAVPPCTCWIGAQNEGEITSAVVSCPLHGCCRECRMTTGLYHMDWCTQPSVRGHHGNGEAKPVVIFADVGESPKQALEEKRQRNAEQYKAEAEKG
jgi:hypothetical protein